LKNTGKPKAGNSLPMDIEAFRNYCLSKPGVTESFPFDEDTLVFKVMGKIFALAGVSDFNAVNLKCEPELAIELRERYPAVEPGYHMNKKHWNTVNFDGSISFKELKEWTDHSYDLVVNSLTKKERQLLQNPGF
jgi:predicted DNA-binding protein (MmcQ/YjbR family)